MNIVFVSILVLVAIVLFQILSLGTIAKQYLMPMFHSKTISLPSVLQSSVEFSLRNFAVPQSLYPSEIIPNFLYLGERGNINAYWKLQELNISVIINMASKDVRYNTITLEKLCNNKYTLINKANVAKLVSSKMLKSGDKKLCIGIDLDDYSEEHIFTSSNNVLDPMVEFLKELKEMNQKVFIHCVGGRSRSASIVIAYLMKYGEADTNSKMTFKEAYEYASKRRAVVAPNHGFLEQLIDYEKHLCKAQYASLSKEEIAKLAREVTAKAHTHMPGIISAIDLSWIKLLKEIIPLNVRTWVRGVTLKILNI